MRAGRWRREYAGVYTIAGIPDSWHVALMAACLSCGSGALVSHESAAGMFVLPDLPQDGIVVTVASFQSVRREFVVHRADVPSIDRTRCLGIPVTTPTRTLIDIAGSQDVQVLEVALDDSLVRRLTSVSLLQRRLESIGRRPGVTRLRRLLAERSDGRPVTPNKFEARFLWMVRNLGLPEPERQHEVRWGRRRFLIDFAYSEHMLAIETDGYRWHSGQSKWRRDLERRNILTELGWRVMHVTWSDLEDRPAFIAQRIARLLGV